MNEREFIARVEAANTEELIQILSRPSPEAGASAAQRLERLRRGLQALPVPARQVLTLSLEGLSGAEIAEVLGITENNAGVRLSRARRALREEMERP